MIRKDRRPRMARFDQVMWRIAIVLLILGAACSSNNGNQSKSALEIVKERGVLKAGIRTDNPPHSFLDEQTNWVGFDVDIAEALATELGVGLEKVKVNELTRISFLKNGTIDLAVASMSHTLKRDAEIDFSQTYFWATQTFLVRKGEVEGLADLAGKRVGMARGSHAIGNWRAWVKSHGNSIEPEILEFSSKQAAVDAVRQGAIAGWAEDATILVSFARLDPTLEVLSDESIGMKQDGIGIRENDSRFRDAVNFALQGMASTGEYDRIYLKWFGPDSDNPIVRMNEIEVWPNG